MTSWAWAPPGAAALRRRNREKATSESKSSGHSRPPTHAAATQLGCTASVAAGCRRQTTQQEGHARLPAAEYWRAVTAARLAAARSSAGLCGRQGTLHVSAVVVWAGSLDTRPPAAPDGAHSVRPANRGSVLVTHSRYASPQVMCPHTCGRCAHCAIPRRSRCAARRAGSEQAPLVRCPHLPKQALPEPQPPARLRRPAMRGWPPARLTAA